MNNNSSQEPNFSSIPQIKGKKGCHIIKDLRGQIIIITGSSAGIGKETARILAYMGATIIFACREKTKALAVLEEIQGETKNPNLEFIRLDLSDLRSIKEFVEEFLSKYQRLDILINNAGITLPERRLTKDGFELIFGTNHLGHFYLTTLLLDVLKKSGPSRIINVSSSLHAYGKMKWDDLMFEKGYGSFPTYNQSKLANILFTRELQKRVDEKEIKVVSLHPGVIKTEMGREFNKWYYKAAMKMLSVFQKSALEGAQTSLYCVLEDFDKLKAGRYYVNCKVAEEAPQAKKEEDMKRLWDVSEKLIGEKVKNF